jgi:phosphohistidine phosphatase
MMHLLLMRHAQADDQVAGQQDWERPLTRRGQDDAKEMAKRLKARKVRIELLLASPALRTRQTADAISKVFPHARVEYVDELYLADRKRLMRIVHQHGGHAKHLMLIAHNPGISEFANELSQERPIDGMPTAAIFDALFDITQWQDLPPASGVNVEFDYPKRCG